MDACIQWIYSTSSLITTLRFGIDSRTKPMFQAFKHRFDNDIFIRLGVRKHTWISKTMTRALKSFKLVLIKLVLALINCSVSLIGVACRKCVFATFCGSKCSKNQGMRPSHPLLVGSQIYHPECAWAGWRETEPSVESVECEVWIESGWIPRLGCRAHILEHQCDEINDKRQCGACHAPK